MICTYKRRHVCRYLNNIIHVVINKFFIVLTIYNFIIISSISDTKKKTHTHTIQ